jgi:ERCC4-type nuclease
MPASVQKVLKSGKVTILADTREAPSRVVEFLRSHDADIRESQLKVGDYICSDRVCIERKTAPDFLQSIFDQRLFTQIEELKGSYKRPVIIIEGDIEHFSERNVNPNSIRGVLASIAIDHQVPLLWTANQKETAGLIYWIAKREQEEGKRELQVRAMKRSNGIKQQQEFLVAGLPHVSNVLARRLLGHFKTPREVFSANEEKLKKVPKIGKEKARKLSEVLDTPYS